MNLELYSRNLRTSLTSRAFFAVLVCTPNQLMTNLTVFHVPNPFGALYVSLVTPHRRTRAHVESHGTDAESIFQHHLE